MQGKIMDGELPDFEYFPDPLGNGCIVRKNGNCACCGQRRVETVGAPWRDGD